ncbi:MAG: hypothetical protein AAB567_00565 [Patescibacteria group bacterium]
MKITKTQSSVSGNPLFRPAKRSVVAALAFMILAPSLLATLISVGRSEVSPETLWAIPTAVGLFAAGWLLVGASLRPYGSQWRGVIAAAVLYILIGAVWVLGFNTAMGTPPLAILRSPQTIIVGALFWPLGVAQLLGLFGLDIG